MMPKRFNPRDGWRLADHHRPLTDVRTLAHTNRVFSPDEQRAIELKALEQAMRAAGVANAEPEPLLPIANTWQATWLRPSDILGEHCFAYACGLTDWDRDFLRTCPYPISPA